MQSNPLKPVSVNDADIIGLKAVFKFLKKRWVRNTSVISPMEQQERLRHSDHTVNFIYSENIKHLVSLKTAAALI